MSEGGRRWPWRDPYDGSLSPGWALTFITAALMLIGVAMLLVNDMHMNGYGPWAR